MRKIDAHIHVFEHLQGFRGEGELYPIGNGRARWANGAIVDMIPPELGDHSFETEVCAQLLKENGVEKAVILQGSFYGFNNEYVRQAVESHPDMFVGAATFDPMARYAEQIYERLTHEMNFKILKFETSSGGGLMSYHSRFDLDKVFMPIAEKCVENQQVLVLDIGSPGMESFQPQALAQIAKANPELKLVVCHLLAPTLQDKQSEEMKRALETLAEPNIYFDLAAVPFNVYPERYPYPTGMEFIRTAKEIVGADKLMWGTDIPSVLFRGTYAELTDYLTEGELFTAEELEKVYYKNALEVYPFENK